MIFKGGKKTIKFDLFCSFFRIRGFLLFVTILMIGAGWTLFKHVFTRREKQVFLVVIPLQVSCLPQFSAGW